MGNLGGGEMLVIFFVALVVLGPTKLPDAARQVGRAVNEIRRISGGFQREMREAMNEPIRAAEEAKAQIIDPFGQASSSASAGPAASATASSATDDPPLPAAAASADATTDSAPDADTGAERGEDTDTAPAAREPIGPPSMPDPPPPFSSVKPEADPVQTEGSTTPAGDAAEASSDDD